MDTPPSGQTSTRTLVIILGALAWGVLCFGAYCLVTVTPGPTNNWSPLVLLGLGLAAGSVVLRMVVPAAVTRSALEKAARQPEEKDRESVSGAIVSSHIVGGALLEGGAFLNLFAYLVEHNPLNLVAGGLLAFGILAAIPAALQSDQRIDDHLRDVRERRRTSGP